MYVCVCNAVTEDAIREALDGGATTLGDVQARLPVGACCGRCHETAQSVVEDYLSSRHRSRAA
jgi:bacterioferritin-associated ferredoxin